VVILLLHVTSPDDYRPAGKSAPMPRQSLAVMRQQTPIMAQLLGQADNADQPVATPAPPKPRSERPRRQFVG
jgi:hypothetical protein